MPVDKLGSSGTEAMQASSPVESPTKPVPTGALGAHDVKADAKPYVHEHMPNVGVHPPLTKAEKKFWKSVTPEHPCYTKAPPSIEGPWRGDQEPPVKIAGYAKYYLDSFGDEETPVEQLVYMYIPIPTQTSASKL